MKQKDEKPQYVRSPNKNLEKKFLQKKYKNYLDVMCTVFCSYVLYCINLNISDAEKVGHIISGNEISGQAVIDNTFFREKKVVSSYSLRKIISCQFFIHTFL